MPTVTKQKRKGPVNRRQSGNIMDRVRPIGFDPDEGIKLNLYGRSGSGKTTLVGTFPKRILFLVCSGGGELRSIDTPQNRKSVDQLRVNKSAEIEEVVRVQRESGEYATVVLDHATGLQDMVLAEILGLEEIPPQLNWGVASQQQYGQCGIQMKTYLRMLLDLRCNVVIIAQEREFNTDTDSDLISPYVASALQPSIVGWLGPAADYVCQTFLRERTTQKKVKVGDRQTVRNVPTGDVEYCLRTAPHPVYASKFRLPKGRELPDVIVDPTYDKIIQLIRGPVSVRNV